MEAGCWSSPAHEAHGASLPKSLTILAIGEEENKGLKLQ
jgi:hypothetical protein